ncbi:TPA: efflux RND transporter periplasmic adaptor subunit [Pasteurella multocida]|uniref:Efflux RND transporter periplasmic adaptor subunit n=1 Tax=Pasteurella multocida TaxID=747 RepID=A0AAW8V7E5_PASMD|nr:efflux RND transporter periplasmic adaptor subunit [Pasteurella multocida]ARB74933.1 efflux RND transporter periplasmic adaptor subunit [Pasteurella multocida]EJZ79811.1 Macrolide-specific efflux protein MacA [Pasteurella multocida subsp. gallicida P1059]MDH7436571.1 efflux RND transporter periplasmic adaptor subunit [Pasteurella multocida]MDH7439628.1 efflux RND transporter periplasmic adaptor subunit [Pasteurella multocida]MDT3452465.1 efflux RND transporter periplasmic adaptor subunit [P
MRKYSKYALLVLLLCLVTFYYISEEENSSDIIFPAIRSDIQKVITASGILQAKEEVEIGSQASGQVKQIVVQEGQRVKKGDLLALIDPRIAETELKLAKAELESAEANLEVKRANLVLSEVNLARHYQLNKKEATTKKDIEEAENKRIIASAELRMAQSQVESAKVKVEKASTELGYTEIRSPLDGVVISVVAQSGQTLAASQQTPVLMKLAVIDTMKVNARVSEADVIDLQVGAPVHFTLLGAPHAQFHAKLAAIKLSPVKVSEATYYYATFEVPNPEHKLRIAMTAEVSILLDKRENVVTLPISALGQMLKPNHYSVTVLNQSGEKEQVIVKTGLKDGARIEIVEGLSEGDNVVLSVNPATSLNDEEIYDLGL